MAHYAKDCKSTIIPSLRYRDAPAAIEWLCQAFGFEKQAVYPNPDGTIAHAQLTFGNGMIMIGSVVEGTPYNKLIRQPDEIGGLETQAPLPRCFRLRRHLRHCQGSRGRNGDGHRHHGTTAGAPSRAAIPKDTSGTSAATIPGPDGNLGSATIPVAFVRGSRCSENTVLFSLLLRPLLLRPGFLSLAQAVETAATQNPDVVYARLDEQRAALDAKVSRDPFSTKLSVGSGLAYTNGFPLSIEGSAPSIIQARVSQSIFNRPQSYQVAQARENARGAALDTQMKREDVALRTANLYLDAQRARRLRDLVKHQVESLEKVLETVRARVAEGRELPIEEKRAEVNLARARQRAKVVEGDAEYATAALASVLGFPPEDRVVPNDDPTPTIDLPPTPEAMVEEALANSRELKRLQSSLLAKGYEIRSYNSSRLPKVELVGQYALLGRFNNYDTFYNGFQRHNGQIGVSFQLPILPGAAPMAQGAQAKLDELRLHTQVNQVRSRISLETRRSYQDYRDAETARDVAKMDLDLARDQIGVLLARLQEGRATAKEIEESRFLENERYIALYDAIHALDQARLALLKQRGGLLTALK